MHQKKTEPGTSSLSVKINALLESRSWRVRFDADLERQYTRDIFADRTSQFRFFGTAGPLIFACFYFDDLAITPDLPLLSAWVRLVMPVLSLLLLHLVLPRFRQLLWHETGISFIAALASICQLSIFYFTHSPDKVTVLNGIFIFVMYGAICIPVRLLVVVPSTILTTAVICGAIQFSDISDVSRVDQISTMLAMMLLTLMVSYKLDHQARRDYLLTRREALRGQELTLKNEWLRDLSEQDGLTGVLNRRTIDARLTETYLDAQAEGWPMGVIMVDVDHFKAYNDHYGHPGGDECLRRVANLLKENVRHNMDRVGRFGGEEFMIVLPKADLAECVGVAERIRRALHELQIPHEATPNPLLRHVTISQGVAMLVPQDPVPLERLVLAADRELYSAKRAGRNRVHPVLPYISGEIIQLHG